MSWHRPQSSRPCFYLDLSNEIKDVLAETTELTPMLCPGSYLSNEIKDVLAQTTAVTPMIIPGIWATV
jgi:hypothetical protein